MTTVTFEANSNLKTLGLGAFLSPSLDNIFLLSQIDTIGENAFRGIVDASVYALKPSGWNNNWCENCTNVIWQQ